MEKLYDLLDARTNVIRKGPYSKEDADKQCELLNRFILENENPLLAALASKITGPFYPHIRK